MAIAAVNNDISKTFPKGSWDAHHHVFDREYLLKLKGVSTNLNSLTVLLLERPHLTPPPATIQQFLTFRQTMGIAHSVLTHGLSYGTDWNRRDRPRHHNKDQISQMHAASIRDVRVNLYKYSAMHEIERQKVALREHARRITRFPGWTIAFTHVHPEFGGDLRPTVETEIASKGIRLVTDRLALVKGCSSLPIEYHDVTKQVGFSEIIALVRDGLPRVKLSASCRVSDAASSHEDLKPAFLALVEANPKRVLWGSYWPRTPRMKVRSHEEAMDETPYLEIDD